MANALLSEEKNKSKRVFAWTIMDEWYGDDLYPYEKKT